MSAKSKALESGLEQRLRFVGIGKNYAQALRDNERMSAAQAKRDRKNAKRARELRAWGQP